MTTDYATGLTRAAAFIAANPDVVPYSIEVGRWHQIPPDFDFISVSIHLTVRDFEAVASGLDGTAIRNGDRVHVSVGYARGVELTAVYSATSTHGQAA